MKKVLSTILCVALLASIGVIGAACSKKNQGEPVTNYDEPAISGGWQKAENPEITKDFQKTFNKAVKKLDGVDYKPVAYLASQVVAGTNHCVLCKATPSTSDAVTRYAILYIYEDLEGNAEVTAIANSTVSVPSYDEPVSGGWGETSSPAVTDEVKAALDKSCETLAGETYSPVAYLQSQVVAGFNYLILCEATPTVPDAESRYVLVTVYSDLSGGAEITSVEEFTAE